MKILTHCYLAALLFFLSGLLPAIAQENLRYPNGMSLQEAIELKKSFLDNPYDAPKAEPGSGGAENTTELDQQFSFALPALAGKSGVESDGDFIYVTSWLGSGIDQYDLTGSLVGSFEIEGVGYICALTYDGTYFYATDATNLVYEIDFDSQELVSILVAPYPVRGIAYDEDQDVFYGADLFSPIHSFDRFGNLLAEFEAGPTSLIYGLAYDNQSEGGPFLYGFSQENNATLVQYSLPDGVETDFSFNVLEDLGLEEGVAGGLNVVKDLLPGTFSLVGLVQSEAVFAYQLGQLEQFENDMALASIDAPESGLNLGSGEAVTVQLLNSGLLPQSGFPLMLFVDGEAVATETFTGSLDPGETSLFTFSQTVNFEVPGQTTALTVCAGLESDEYPENDCKTKLVTFLEPVYCVPFSNCNLGDGFDNFILGDIENLESGCSENGYGDFTGLSTVLEGSSIHTVTFSCGFGSQQVSLWIDTDQDYQFEPDELLIADFDASFSGEMYAVDFEIPQDALNGETRLRIRSNWLSSSADPCAVFTWGETEDYTVYIENDPLTANVGLISLQLPSFVQSTAISPLAVVKNFGLETQSFPVEIASGDYTSLVEVMDLAPGETVQVEFDVWEPAPGNYSVVACTQLEGDENPANDCQEADVVVVAASAAYAYVNYDPGNLFEEGWVVFDVSDPGTLVQLSISPLYAPLVGATWVDSIIYAVAYDGEIYSFDPATAEQNLLFEDTPLFGIAFDGSTFYGNSAAELFTLDIVTGELSLIGPFENPDLGGIVSMAADGQGNLFGVDLGEDVLYAIDKETAVATTIGPLGGNFITILDISFDQTSNTLYFAGQTYSGESGLYVIDTQTGEAIFAAPFQTNLHISALAIPSGNLLFLPPENLQANLDGTDVSLTWSEPFTGSFIGFNVYRDGTMIGFSDLTTFSDPALDFGIYQYQVSTVYPEGESALTAPLEVAVGNPEVIYDPVSITEVLEMGESVVRQVTLVNAGNIDLHYSIASSYNMNGKYAGSSAPMNVSPQEYAQHLQLRFGADWLDYVDPEVQPWNGSDEISDYCIPTSNCYFGDGINTFELAEITNINSGCSPLGYGDFTDLVATLSAGMTYDVSVSSSYSSNFANVWIDLNQDGVFDDSERLLTDFQLDIAGEVYTTQLTIPSDAQNGETRLRVMGSWLYSNQDPCLNTTFGETEDYTVVIGGSAPWIALDPASGSVAPGDTAIVAVTLDATSLDVMEYNASLLLSTNDTLNSGIEIPVSLTVIEQSLSNFEPVWETPFNPMSVFVVQAQIDGMDLQLGDEVGIFDVDPLTGETICVGAGLVTEPLNGTVILEVIVSMDDGASPDTSNGFTPGNEMLFRLWTSEMGEVVDVIAEYPNPGFDEVFTPLGTAFVTLQGEALVTQQMALEPGWNLISSMAEPLNSNMMTLFQPLIDLQVLEKVTDQSGGNIMYIPYPEPQGRWINSIGEMSMSEGYYVKVNDGVDVSMEGLPVQFPFEIPFSVGWNIMGFPAEEPQDALQVLQPLIDEGLLYKVLDDAGGLIQYIPFPEPNGQWINTIGDFANGKGYYLKVHAEASLTLVQTGEAAGNKSFLAGDQTLYFEPVYQNNPYMPMHIILMTSGLLSDGDEVGIFDGDVCVGASAFDANNPGMSITVAGMDDPDTEEVDGFVQGNTISIKVFSNGVLYDQMELEYIEGSETFAALDSYVGNLTGWITGVEPTVNTRQNFFEVLPNPASDKARITLNLASESHVRITFLDFNGRPVKQPVEKNLPSGKQTIPVELTDLQAGMYLVRVEIEGPANDLLYQKLVVQ